MSAEPTVIERAKQNGVAFLLTDLDVALTFMDVARNSKSQVTIRRNHGNARKAYDTVVRLLEKVAPDAAQKDGIQAKLAIVKERLEAAGQKF